MALINRILSGFSGQITPLPAGGAPVQPSAPGGVGRDGVAGDSFIRGQWWRNRAAGEGAGGNGQYGVAAYRAQEKAESGLKEPEGVRANDIAETPQQGATPETARESSPEQSTDRTGGNEQGDERQTISLADRKTNGDPLTEAEKQQITQLTAVDTEVRAHEMAHLAVAGPYALGGANFEYQRGPNGKNYAVAGEVSIDTSEESSPQATIDKMQTVRAAALAPANPSGQDRLVAASATVKTSEARQELSTERLQELELQRRANAPGRGTAENSAGAEAASPSSQETPPVPVTGPENRTPPVPPARIRAYTASPSGRFSNSLDLVA